MNFSDATLVIGDTQISLTNVSVEYEEERLNTIEKQDGDAMATDSRTQTAEDSRVQKARRIEVQEVFEPRDGIYVVDFINEDGEERRRVLIPSKLFSDNPDMIFRSGDGIVGKYTIAAARENDQIRADLALALEERQDELDEEIQSAREQVEEAAEEFNNLNRAKQALQSEV
jgi:hypothetical protein